MKGKTGMKLSQQIRKLWNNNITLRKRIVYAMILLIVIPVVFLGMTIFQISKRTIENNYQNSHVHNLQVSSEMMDIYLQKIIDEGRTLLENQKFIQIMLSENNGSSYFSSRNQLAVDSALSNIAAHNSLINGVLVVNTQGNWRYYAKSKIYSGYLNHYYTTDQLLDEEWIQAAIGAKGKEVFYPSDVLLEDKAKDCFCYVKHLINPSTQKPFGFLVMSIDKKIWEDSFGRDTEGFETNRYMVMKPEVGKNAAGVVYFTGKDEEKQQILNAYDNNDNSVFLFSSYTNSITGWSIMNVITKQELEKDSDYILRIVILVMVTMILVSIAAATLISRYITNPLNQLAKTISEVEAGKRKVMTQFDDSEVGRIGNRFKALVNNNLELREHLLNMEIKEKDAQLLLLQSQINPHFLYNTLDALYFMALIEQADDIADMVQALSNMFKLSLNRGDKLIALRDEIDWMKDYMKIQNFRFQDRFILHIDVEEELLDYKILTFLLQPILENAVYHGLESQIGAGNIYLSARRRKDILYLSIRDDGVGIQDMSKLEKGYGIKNIKERIRLNYGSDSSVTVTSGTNVGTTVCITIPYQEGEVKVFFDQESYMI
jgi:two-component system sensor histidine kinase YesM